MRKAITLFFLALLVLKPVCMGQDAPLPVPEMTAIAFSPDDGGKALVVDSAGLGHVVDTKLSGGEVVETKDGFDWVMKEEAAFGVGRLDIKLDRGKIASDLAMVMNASLSPKANVAVQLYDAEGKALALDLFGAILWRAEGAGTDTLIIPLEKYPDAVRLVLRRLNGGVVVREILLTPVLSETSMNGDREEYLAKVLGERISRHHAIVRARKGLGELAVHSIPSLEEINDVGAAALSAVGYPAYRPLGLGRGELIDSSVSGTVYDFAIVANRYLSLQQGGEAFDWFFTSSAGVEYFFKNEYRNPEDGGLHSGFGMASVPLREDAKEAFLARNGYYPLEFPIARNAIEVIANAGLPIDSLSMDELRRIFGMDGETVWGGVGLDGEFAGEKIEVFGGSPDWGTARMFQKIVLKGDDWRNDIVTGKDVIYGRGVEMFVGNSPGGIGYAVQRKRTPAVKKITIRETEGSPAFGATAEAIYSEQYPLQRKLYAYVAAPRLQDASPQIREMVNLILSSEGQTMMVKTNSLPLSVAEVVESRSRLGL